MIWVEAVSRNNLGGEVEKRPRPDPARTSPGSRPGNWFR